MIDWDNASHRIALLQLVLSGRVRKSRDAQVLLADLLAEGWVKQSTRSGEFDATTHGAQQAAQILAARWPAHEEDFSLMKAAFGGVNARALMLLKKQQARLLETRVPMPPLVNRKTFAAAVTGHSKIALPDAWLARYPGTVLVADHPVFLRANAGLMLRAAGDGPHGGYDCDLAMCFMGVVHVSERRLVQGMRLAGVMPRAVLTVENPATFYDMPLPDDVMGVLVSGWDTRVPERLLRLVPQDIPHVHFGDYDPAGLQIVTHLRELLGKPLQWLAPAFTTDYLDTHALPFRDDDVRWASVAPGPEEPAVVAWLRRANKWMEQEAITLDTRLTTALENAITAAIEASNDCPKN